MSTGFIMGNTTTINTITVNWTPALVATATTADQTLTVPGVRTIDYVEVTAPSLVAGVAITGARVTANDTIAVTFVNPTATSRTPPAGTYQVLQIRPEATGVNAIQV